MTTQINVRVTGGGVVGQNKRDAEANRQSLRNREEQAITISGAQRGLIQVNGQTAPGGPSKARRSQYVREKPAASRIIFGNKIGHFWWIVDNEDISNTGYISTGIFRSFDAPNVFGTARVGIKRTSRLFCGDGSKSIEIEHGQQSQQMISTDPDQITFYPRFQLTNSVMEGVGNDDYANALILPAGYGSFVIVFLASTARTTIDYPKNGAVSVLRETIPNPSGIGVTFVSELLSFTKTTQISVTRRCFVCSNTNIREISVPSVFSGLLDLIHASTPAEVLLKKTVLTGINRQLYYIETTFPIFNRWVPNGSLGSTIAFTPDVFYQATQILEDDSNAAQAALWSSLLGGAVKPLPPSLRWAIEDTAEGAYMPSTWNNQTLRQLFNSSERFRYGSWRTPGEVPTAVDGSYDPALYTKDSSATLSLAPSRPSLSPAPVVYKPVLEDGLYAVWDWNDPSYCRQMLLALGFNPADLTL